MVQQGSWSPPGRARERADCGGHSQASVARAEGRLGWQPIRWGQLAALRSHRNLLLPLCSMQDCGFCTACPHCKEMGSPSEPCRRRECVSGHASRKPPCSQSPSERQRRRGDLPNYIVGDDRSSYFKRKKEIIRLIPGPTLQT